MMNKKLISAVFALVSLFSLAFIQPASAAFYPNGLSGNALYANGLTGNGLTGNGLKSEMSSLQSLASQSLGVVVKTETAK